MLRRAAAISGCSVFCEVAMKKKLLLIVCLLLTALTLTACAEILGLAVDLLASEPEKTVSDTATMSSEPDEATDEIASFVDSIAEENASSDKIETKPDSTLPDINGAFDSKEEVALYIHVYGCLPSNYITKKQAQALGWPGGSLEPYAPGKSIGGDYFGNYEGTLPSASGRSYHECDIGTMGANSRGAKRIVFSNDGLIYYTEDHYENFELLYGEE